MRIGDQNELFFYKRRKKRIFKLRVEIVYVNFAKWPLSVMANVWYDNLLQMTQNLNMI